MASFPGLCQAVGPAEENGELDGSLQQMLKAIADERTRLNLRQEISGLGELRGSGDDPRLLELQVKHQHLVVTWRLTLQRVGLKIIASKLHSLLSRGYFDD